MAPYNIIIKKAWSQSQPKYASKQNIFSIGIKQSKLTAKVGVKI